MTPDQLREEASNASIAAGIYVVSQKSKTPERIIDLISGALDYRDATHRVELEKVKAERDALLRAEHKLSEAYLRLRSKLNAFDTPKAPTAEQVWKHTEDKLDQVLQERDALKEELQQLRTYCTLTFGESHPEMKKCPHELERDAALLQVERMREKFKELADFTPHCCEDCPCDYFRQAAEEALSSSSSLPLEEVRAMRQCVEICMALEMSVEWELAPEIMKEINDALSTLAKARGV